MSTIEYISPGLGATSDNIPADFVFTDVGSRPLGSTQTSNAVTITDIGVDAHPGFNVFTTSAAGVSPGLFRINSGQWEMGNGVASLNDTIEVMHIASDDNSTQVNTTLLFPDGNVSDTFTSTTVAQPSAGVVFSDDFSGGDLSKWESHGDAVFWSSNEGPTGGPCARVDYTGTTGTAPYSFRKNVLSLQLQEFYVYFDFKETVRSSGGCKFLKIFGAYNPADPNYANTTAQMDYGSGFHTDLFYGNGAGVSNDNTYRISHAGTEQTWDPPWDQANVYNPASPAGFKADGNWHSFEFHMRYNTTGLRDGLYEVWYDGVLLASVSNVKNKHDSNHPYPRLIGLADFHNLSTTPWSLWYANVVFSTERIGT